MTHNFGKVWAGSYGENHLIINGEALEPVSFKEDDEGGDLCDALGATGVTAAMVDEELIVSSDEPMLVEGHLPNGVMINGFAAIQDLDAGLYE